MSDDAYSVGKAKESDCEFLAVACLQSERAHLGRGIWDVLLGSGARPETPPTEAETAFALRVLAHSCRNDTASGFHYSRFWVVRHGTGEAAVPVAAAAGYRSPDCDMGTAIQGFAASAQHVASSGGGDEEPESAADWRTQKGHGKAAMKRLRFLHTAFPDPMPALGEGGQWIIEAVYTDAAHRGHGLAARLLHAVLDAGREAGCPTCVINTHVGNDAALRVYESKLGFKLWGAGDSEECKAGLGCPGFSVLTMDLAGASAGDSGGDGGADGRGGAAGGAGGGAGEG